MPRLSFETRVEGGEIWEDLVTRRKGFVLVTAHLGNWEIGSTMPATRDDLTIHLVREAELDADSQDFIESLLKKLGGVNYHTHFAQGDLALGVELMTALRKGEVVALQGDRPRAGGQTMEVELFGHPYEVPVGPAVLARLAGVPLIPSFTLREGRRKYRVLFRPPIHVPRTRDRDADHRVALEAMIREVEHAVRQEPYQWFCWRDLKAAGARD